MSRDPLGSIGTILDGLVTSSGGDRPRKAGAPPKPTNSTRPSSRPFEKERALVRTYKARQGRPLGGGHLASPGKEKVSLRLPPELIAQYRDWSWDARSSLSGLAEQALREYLRRRNPNVTSRPPAPIT